MVLHSLNKPVCAVAGFGARTCGQRRVRPRLLCGCSVGLWGGRSPGALGGWRAPPRSLKIPEETGWGGGGAPWRVWVGGGGRLAGESSAEGPGSKVHFQGHRPPQILRMVPRGVSAEKGQVVPGRARVLPGPDVGTWWRTEQGRVTFPVSPLSPRRGRGVCGPRLARGDGRPAPTNGGGHVPASSAKNLIKGAQTGNQFFKAEINNNK